MCRALSFAVTLAICVLVTQGCGPVKCGDGTYQFGDECRAPEEEQHVTCGVGFTVKGGQCVPDGDWVSNFCDEETSTYDPNLGKCIGVGGTATTACTSAKYVCPTPAAGKTCITGRVFTVDSWLAQGENGTPVDLAGEKLKVHAIDIMSVAAPTPTSVGSATAIDEDGCFILPDVTVPGMKTVGLVVQEPSGSTVWVKTATLLDVSAGTTYRVNVVAAKKTLLAEWDKELGGADLETTGVLVLQITKPSGPVEGAVFLQNGKLPEDWTAGEQFFFSDDPSTAPYFDLMATGSKKRGGLLVKDFPMAVYSVQVGSVPCADPGKPAQSVSGWLFFDIGELDGTSC